MKPRECRYAYFVKLGVAPLKHGERSGIRKQAAFRCRNEFSFALMLLDERGKIFDGAFGKLGYIARNAEGAAEGNARQPTLVYRLNVNPILVTACKYLFVALNFAEVLSAANGKPGFKRARGQAKFEEEIAEMDAEEAAMFMEDLGLTQRGLDRLIRTSYDLLGYISFLTAGEDDVHAWTITRGTKAPQAAGKIHSDLERGFIRAEIVAFEDLKACGTMAAARDKGLLRSEGKDYVMQDGDVTNIRFNV